MSKKVDQELKMLETMQEGGFSSKAEIDEQMKVVFAARKERDAKLAEEASFSDELKNAPPLSTAMWRTPGTMSALSDGDGRSIHSGRMLSFKPEHDGAKAGDKVDDMFIEDDNIDINAEGVL